MFLGRKVDNSGGFSGPAEMLCFPLRHVSFGLVRYDESASGICQDREGGREGGRGSFLWCVFVLEGSAGRDEAAICTVKLTTR